ncbi:hypothetical protein D187_006808 [Cystobacter fuscus DSM 2262]|uniref:Probable membrane transporter protein n=1 Tax=Cystobacter fuscus (strain ATCC 25194 / DSM 2262 / NBRC 100088 / M29) TaxID=1242864 RepID=S9Q6V6_CYSF2|nr:sulfite exporter TauE/SafE family protein [Cystobacter fuscus]EPX57054.1 hypothetical protein D187_006808 [Cystobacter fuscus DSM 2262]
MPFHLILAIALSSVIGLSLGLLGGGGSILAVPVLVYVAGVTPHAAVPMSLAIVGTTSLVAGLLHQGSGRVSLKAALLFGAAGMGGAWFGAKLTHLISGRVLLLLFALLMLVVGSWMLAPFTQRLVAGSEQSEGRKPHLVLTLVAGLGVGGLTGFLGVGGGFLVVPALVLFCRLPIEHAVGTSLYVIALNSAAGFIGHPGGSRLSLGLTIAFTAAALVGAVVGHRIATRMHPQRLRSAFAWFVILVGAGMVARTLLSRG